jgi:glycerol-3-phosphate dehydrogenase subunit B
MHQAALVVDEDMRLLDVDGCVAYNNIFPAGSELAHQDWVRMKRGAGLAVATACGRSFAPLS